MTEKEKREQIHKILDMILDINGLEERIKEKTGDAPTAFFRFSGHTAGVTINIYDNGWDENVETPPISITGYLDQDLGKVINEIEDFIKNSGGRNEKRI